MLASYGFYLLYLCCLTSLYGFVSAVAAGLWRHRRLYRSSRLALTLSCAMTIGAAGILWFLLFQRDYSVAYIFRNSSNDLPAYYTLTAFWSALEGSHFFWTLLLSIFSTIALWTFAKDNEHIMPYVAASLQVVLAWMYYLLISYSDPFNVTLPAHANGQGMNALLQNPYMAIHPPSLFTGYTSLAIPFAYSIAALCYGDITEGWLKTTRRWTLFAWCFLTGAIFLGGRWAYVELGWSGYWAWDPVENSSLMPWLCATALLHSLIVQDKLGHLKRLSIILAIFAFFLSFFGTFMTRSGIVSSVHSFAESPIGPNYLTFLAALLLIAATLYALRAPSILPPETDKVWGFSKESALVVTQFLILTFSAVVFIGTIFPIVSEAITGQKTSVQAPYFNRFAPWIGLGVIVAVAVGNLMRYQSQKIVGGSHVMRVAALIALPIATFLMYRGDVFSTANAFGLSAQMIGIYLVSWSIACLALDFVDRVRAIRWQWRLFFARNLGYCGGFVAHIGILVAIFGFLGNYRGMQKEATLKAGESTQLYGYDFKFENMTVEKNANATLFVANMQVTRNGERLEDLRPAKSQYPTKQELLTEVAVMGSFWHDIYAVVTDFGQEKNQQVTLKLNINPTVRIVWISAFLMVLGGLISLFDKFRGNRSRDVTGGAWELAEHV